MTMASRTRARKYFANDLTHTVSDRSADFDDGELRLKCMECDKWYEHLVDTRAKGHYVCFVCYRKYANRHDWKCWEAGY